MISWKLSQRLYVLWRHRLIAPWPGPTWYFFTKINLRNGGFFPMRYSEFQRDLTAARESFQKNGTWCINPLPGREWRYVFILHHFMLLTRDWQGGYFCPLSFIPRYLPRLRTNHRQIFSTLSSINLAYPVRRKTHQLWCVGSKRRRSDNMFSRF